MLLERFNPRVIFKSLFFFAAAGLGDWRRLSRMALAARREEYWLSKESWPSRVLV